MAADLQDTRHRWMTLHPDCPRWLAEVVITAIAEGGAAPHCEIVTNGRSQTVLAK